MSTFDTEAFIRAYLECALWATHGPDEEPHQCENLDDIFGIDDIAPSALGATREECLDFIRANRRDLGLYCARMANAEWSGEARAGHDFFLTRCGHGAGFWDRGLGALGDRLADAARVYGDAFYYPGDDGRVYLSGSETWAPELLATVRRDPETGRPVLFYVNQSPRGYWVECFDREGVNQPARAYMLRCELVKPVSPYPDDVRDIIRAFESFGPEDQRVRVGWVARLRYPRGLRYIGK